MQQFRFVDSYERFDIVIYLSYFGANNLELELEFQIVKEKKEKKGRKKTI